MKDKIKAAVKKRRSENGIKKTIMEFLPGGRERRAETLIGATADVLIARVANSIGDDLRAAAKAARDRAAETGPDHESVTGSVAKDHPEVVANTSRDLANYRGVVTAFLQGDHEVAKEQYKSYLSAQKLADPVIEALTEAYSGNIAKRVIPPAVHVGDGNRERAKYYEGTIFLNIDATSHSGSPEAALHEFSHYRDHAWIRGQDYEVRHESTTGPKSPLVSAFDADAQNIRTNGFTLSNGEKNLKFVTNKDADGIYLGSVRIPTILGDVVGAATIPNYDPQNRDHRQETAPHVGRLCNSIQSVLGFEFGFGHSKKYVNDLAGTYNEAVAECLVYLQSKNHDFVKGVLGQMFPSAMGVLKGYIS
jgi:hypothetical protein